MFNQVLAERLKKRKSDNLFRVRRLLHSPTQVEVVCDQKKCISFCSSDYLGLANHLDVKAAFKKGVDEYGVGSGASALIVGYHAPHQALEEAFSAFMGREKSLFFSSGYMANLGVLTALVSKKDYIYADKYNHASLIDGGLSSPGMMKRYSHRDVTHLKKLLSEHSNALAFIVTDSVFSMDGDVAPVPEILSLAKEKKAALMIDDAHGIGVLGATGKGITEHFNLHESDVDILVSPLGKALGCSGALVSGSANLIENLVQFARTYMYNTAIPPAVACAALASLNILQSQPERIKKLNQNVDYFKSAAKARDLVFLKSDTPIQPFVIGSAEKTMQVSQKLFEKGFMVTAIRSPSVPENTARLRITITAQHEQHQMEHFLDVLKSICT